MASLDWSQCPAVESVPGRRSGAWVFKDTRMPVATVFENLEAGAAIAAARPDRPAWLTPGEDVPAQPEACREALERVISGLLRSAICVLTPFLVNWLR
jgi:hypothetical protein